MKARVPVYGDLEFRRGRERIKGESVGREWDYRGYIPGARNSPHRAMWQFRQRDLDAGLAAMPAVRCEFEFDIFRTSKGEENRGVFCTFYVVTHQVAKDVDVSAQAFEKRTKGLSKNARPDPDATEK